MVIGVVGSISGYTKDPHLFDAGPRCGWPPCPAVTPPSPAQWVRTADDHQPDPGPSRSSRPTTTPSVPRWLRRVRTDGRRHCRTVHPH